MHGWVEREEVGERQRKGYALGLKNSGYIRAVFIMLVRGSW